MDGECLGSALKPIKRKQNTSGKVKKEIEWGGKWDGCLRGKGTEVYLWLIHVAVWKKPTQCCKAIIFQLN